MKPNCTCELYDENLGHEENCMNVKPTHTPTPWSAELLDKAETFKNEEANIEFMLRAVNCHEELVGMMKVYRNDLMEKVTRSDDKRFLEMYQLVDTAIAKAEGK